MLSAIGRAALRRVVTRRPKSTNRALQSLHRVNGLCINRSSSDFQPFLSGARSYRTPGSANKAPSESKTTTKKAAPKKKPVAKKPVKKKAAKKAKPKVKKAPKKKVLTEIQKSKLEAQKSRLQFKALKDTALVTPKKLPENVNALIIAEVTTGGKGKFSEAIEKYRALTPAEKEHYNHIANQNKAANLIAYKKWVEEHTPDEIHKANNARKQLKKSPKSKAYWPLIEDPRQPKRPANAYAKFCQDRYASGDFKGIKTTDVSKLLSSEYKALTASEKKKYDDLALADTQRYIQEYRTVFKRDSPLAQNAS